MAPKDLGPQPEPEIEPGEPNPGGADAVDAADEVGGERTRLGPDVPNPDPRDNPAVDALPEEMRELEDTSTEATRDDDGKSDTQPEEESPA